jgi:hypothetical protein
MNDPQLHQHGGPNPKRRPYWKRAHRSPFFWVAAIAILAAMAVYVFTDNLAFRPGRGMGRPMPAIAPSAG